MLQHALEEFSRRANANQQVRRLAGAWQTQLYIETTDATDCFRLLVVDGVISGVERTPAPIHETLLLRGRARVLQAVFEGRLHPLSAFNDGELEIYGPQPDQIKLDAISLLIWGA